MKIRRTKTATQSPLYLNCTNHTGGYSGEDSQSTMSPKISGENSRSADVVQGRPGSGRELVHVRMDREEILEGFVCSVQRPPECESSTLAQHSRK